MEPTAGHFGLAEFPKFNLASGIGNLMPTTRNHLFKITAIILCQEATVPSFQNH